MSNSDGIGRNRSPRRLVRRATAGVFVAILLCASYPGFAQSASEYQVKAAYLYNFGKFIEWPASARLSKSDSFAICIFGRDPFGRRSG